MYTKEALRRLGVGDLSETQRKALDDDGFIIVESVFSSDECAEMGEAFDRLCEQEGDRGGHEVHIEPGAPRVSDIFNKTDVYDRCLACGPVLAASHYMLGEFKLHGANLREPSPGQGHQQLHSDVPKNFADDWWVCNGLLLFDDMTRQNGPTRVIPGSHLWPTLNVAAVNQANWTPPDLTPEEQNLIPQDLDASHPNEILVEAPAGSAVIINSALWHSGTRNESGARRRVLHLSYTRRDLPQQLYQRDFLTRALYERLGPEQRFLLDIEPLPDGSMEAGRMPKRKSNSWWN